MHINEFQAAKVGQVLTGSRNKHTVTRVEKLGTKVIALKAGGLTIPAEKLFVTASNCHQYVLASS